MSFTPKRLNSDLRRSATLFPENLRYLRKRRGLNQEDISVLFNKKANTVGNWENGKAEPSIPELLVISGYFGINLEDLLRTGLNQRQAERERQLSLWPEVEKIGEILAGSVAGEPVQAAAKEYQPVALPGSGNTSGNNEHYNNNDSNCSGQTLKQEATPPAGDDAMWFMLRELKNVQERLDRLQSAFDHSRPYRSADKSDH